MKNGRLLWGVLAGVLILALASSVFLSRGAVADAETEAQRRAEDYTNTVLFNNLTPELVSKPIVGPDYRDLIIPVQIGILSDDHVARVRLWTTDGLLIFSTDQLDHQGEYMAEGNPQIQAAAGGSTVSLPTPATVAPRSGLAGSDEKLYQTFVPLRLQNELGVSGVSEIDQRYSAIQGDANSLWRPLQIVLLAGLVIVVVLFAQSLRVRPAAAEAGVRGAGAAVVPSSSPGDNREVEERLRLAEEEARAAQLRADKAEEQLIRAEERASRAETTAREAEKVAQSVTADPARRGVPGVGAATAGAVVATTELEQRAKAAESERERMVSEVQRLRAALAERDAQLALARETGTSGEGETAKVLDLAKQHEAKAAEAESRATEAAKRAAQAEERASELEAELGVAEAARIAAEAVVARTASDEETKASTALRAAELEMNELKGRLTETETALSDARAKLDEHEQGVEDFEVRRAAVATELETARAAAAQDLEAIKAELAKRDESLEAAEQARAALADELERTMAETSKTAAAAGSADELAVEVSALRKQVAELEDQSRSGVSELQRAQEALANTQIEATRSKRRAKELEERIGELESEPALLVETGYEEPARMASVVHRGPARDAEREPYAELEPRAVPEAHAAPLDESARPHVSESEPEPEGEQEPAEAEGLSLRERLARAAAARHRPPGSGPPEER